MVKKTPAAAANPDAPQPPGYYRNAGGLELTILGPSMTVAIGPGRIGYLPFDSRHRDLEAASEAECAAQQAEDAKATAAAEQTTPEE